ncbi:uncharacterized protein LOC128248060 [Octopus bimaculoides]|uniref:uncharacterized protein LOC128248060 n=1 Tax=Octopus bimaculoides TaxID=37653 RepID=UPI0022E5528C|nr:uncharacterized protein LOC128248060 [Octopus bimaculoides]
MTMKRLFTFCLLSLTTITTLIGAFSEDCDGCSVEGQCHSYGEIWLEKTDIMCALKLCRWKSETKWRVYTKTVYCRDNYGNCVTHGKTWASLENTECWTRTCSITGSNSVRVISKSGGQCFDR